MIAMQKSMNAGKAPGFHAFVSGREPRKLAAAITKLLPNFPHVPAMQQLLSSQLKIALQ
jgi:hypothetical protein